MVVVVGLRVVVVLFGAAAVVVVIVSGTGVASSAPRAQPPRPSSIARPAAGARHLSRCLNTFIILIKQPKMNYVNT